MSSDKEKLRKGKRVYEVQEFIAPDRVLLRGEYKDFEEEIAKAVNNGYTLVSPQCGVSALREAWKNCGGVIQDA